MNARAEAAIVSRNADSTVRWTGTFDMPAAFVGRTARDARLPSPMANAPLIVSGFILVGHTCPLVEMGLLATLRRQTLHNVVTLDDLNALPPEKLEGRNIAVVVADCALAGRLAKFAISLDRSGGQASPKVLLIGADASLPGRIEARASYDARLALECCQEDLVDIVNALIGSGKTEIAAHSMRFSARDLTALRAGNDKGGPVARVTPYGADEGPRRIEGIALHAQGNAVTNRQPRGGLPPGALRRVREAMEQRLGEKLELPELAAVAGVSRCHFARAFKESVGQSPHRYLMMRRVEGAAVLIKDTGLSLTDISMDMGFFDQSHFTRVFTRIVGETPSAYRRRHR